MEKVTIGRVFLRELFFTYCSFVRNESETTGYRLQLLKTELSVGYVRDGVC